MFHIKCENVQHNFLPISSLYTFHISSATYRLSYIKYVNNEWHTSTTTFFPKRNQPTSCTHILPMKMIHFKFAAEKDGYVYVISSVCKQNKILKILMCFLEIFMNKFTPNLCSHLTYQANYLKMVFDVCCLFVFLQYIIYDYEMYENIHFFAWNMTVIFPGCLPGRIQFSQIYHIRNMFICVINNHNRLDARPYSICVERLVYTLKDLS